MLQFVHLGVAMGNARPGVKDIADDVTGRVDRDGTHDGFAKRGPI
jgi:hydroxymethylpyrimidine pyrophosphatase-like HAD family hydrolase